jgi:hypothetical protein
MQFKPDEYLLLSRRGSVPSSSRAGPPPEFGCEPGFGWESESRMRAKPATVRRGRRKSALRGHVRVRAGVRRALNATWTAFGNGTRDL